MSHSKEHLTSDFPTRIEWIDDTSANLVFDNPAMAIKALDQLSLELPGYQDSFTKFQLRSAKGFSSYPLLELQVRMSMNTDQKRPRAYEASRFYMMHPEHDPRERYRSKRRDNLDCVYRKPRYGDDEQRRRKQGDRDQGFTADMYDDNAESSAARNKDVLDRRASISTLSSHGSRSGYRRDSYRLERSGHMRSRDRSASPKNAKNSENSRQKRRRTPPPPYREVDLNPFPRVNSSKELFPLKLGSNIDVSSKMKDLFSNTTPKELFPNKKTVASLKKELLPLKSGTSVHRRSDAFDAADETAELFATGMPVPFVDGTSDSPSISERSLADGVIYTKDFISGRLKRTGSNPNTCLKNPSRDGEFSIRGASRQLGYGFSILGRARGGLTNDTAEELFPRKTVGNAGKELFAEKVEGRGGRRNKAADMFG